MFISIVLFPAAIDLSGDLLFGEDSKSSSAAYLVLTTKG